MAGEFLLANGRGRGGREAGPLARAGFLAVGELTGRAAASRILLAAPMTFAEVEAVAGADIVTADEVKFEDARASLAARRVTRLGAITLAERPLPVPDDETAARILAVGLGRIGLARLPWSKALAPMARPGRLLAQSGGRTLA